MRKKRGEELLKQIRERECVRFEYTGMLLDNGKVKLAEKVLVVDTHREQSTPIPLQPSQEALENFEVTTLPECLVDGSYMCEYWKLLDVTGVPLLTRYIHVHQPTDNELLDFELIRAHFRKAFTTHLA